MSWRLRNTGDVLLIRHQAQQFHRLVEDECEIDALTAMIGRFDFRQRKLSNLAHCVGECVEFRAKVFECARVRA